MADGQDQVSRLDTGVPHSARVWNYWLGGKDNFAADRAVGDQVREIYPEVVEIALASRAFLARAVRFLAGEAGIGQFLDVGTGLPTADNTHEVAQRIAPWSRIVYVDNDLLVLTHARALLTSSPQGATAYIDADVRDPDTIVQVAAETLDFSQPPCQTSFRSSPSSCPPGSDSSSSRGQLPRGSVLTGSSSSRTLRGHSWLGLKPSSLQSRSPDGATTPQTYPSHLVKSSRQTSWDGG